MSFSIAMHNAGGEYQLYMEFYPVIAKKYWEMWTLKTPKGNIRIALMADAIEPSFTVGPSLLSPSKRRCRLGIKITPSANHGCIVCVCVCVCSSIPRTST